MLESLVKILKGAIEHWLSGLLAIAGVAIGGRVLWLYRAYLKDWLFSTRYVEMPGWVWVLICVIGLVIIVCFIWGIVGKLGRRKNRKDIVFAIEDWFANGDEFGDTPQTNTPYFFSGIEKSLNIKHGRSKMYLPLIAMKHGYAFQMGEKTFTLTERTIQNDPINIIERFLKPLQNGEKEILLSCKNIDDELGWPKGVAKLLLLNMDIRNMNFEIEVKDMGGDKIHIIRKK